MPVLGPQGLVRYSVGEVYTRTRAIVMPVDDDFPEDFLPPCDKTLVLELSSREKEVVPGVLVPTFYFDDKTKRYSCKTQAFWEYEEEIVRDFEHLLDNTTSWKACEEPGMFYVAAEATYFGGFNPCGETKVANYKALEPSVAAVSFLPLKYFSSNRKKNDHG